MREEWPEAIRDIYDEALRELDGDEMPLNFGPAHVVWEDGDFEIKAVKFCLEACETFDMDAEQLAVVRRSLERLLDYLEKQP